MKIAKSTIVKKVDQLCEDGLVRRVDIKGKTGQIKQLYEVVDERETMPDDVGEKEAVGDF